MFPLKSLKKDTFFLLASSGLQDYKYIIFISPCLCKAFSPRSIFLSSYKGISHIVLMTHFNPEQSPFSLITSAEVLFSKQGHIHNFQVDMSFRRTIFNLIQCLSVKYAGGLCTPSTCICSVPCSLPGSES